MSDVRVKLRQGWNQLLIPMRNATRGGLCLVVRTESRLRFACRGDAGGSPWAVIGPFPLTQRQQQRAANHMDESLILCRPLVAAATAEAAVQVWEQQDLEWALEQPFFREVAAEDLPEVNVFAQSYTDKVHDEEVRSRRWKRCSATTINGLLSIRSRGRMYGSCWIMGTKWWASSGWRWRHPRDHSRFSQLRVYPA